MIFFGNRFPLSGSMLSAVLALEHLGAVGRGQHTSKVTPSWWTVSGTSTPAGPSDQSLPVEAVWLVILFAVDRQG